MTVREIEDALRPFSLADEVLVWDKEHQHHLAIEAIGHGVGGLPEIRMAVLPAGKAAVRS